MVFRLLRKDPPRPHFEAEASTPAEHPRTIGWIGASALAMGGSNQSLFLMAALIAAQGSAAVPLLAVGLLLAWAALPGWTELVLMWPKRVGGIAATCAEAFRPYSAVLANLTGVCYWWGWIPTCGLTAILSASALHQWYLPGIPITPLAIGIVLVFLAVNLCGVRWAARTAVPIAVGASVLAFAASLGPVLTGNVDWRQSFDFSLATPFGGTFGAITSAMAGLYLIGFAAPAFEAAACHVGEMRDPGRSLPRAMYASAGMASVYFVILPVVLLGVIGVDDLGVVGSTSVGDRLATALGPAFAPVLGSAAKAAVIWFMMLNMFHGTLQPLAGAARTLSQLSEDGLLPRVLARRNRKDAPWVATSITALMAIGFLLTGDPPWLIAAANLTYLIGICLPSVAVWLLRRNAPEMDRPYRAPRFTIGLGLAAAVAWLVSTVLGFQQYGMPSVLAGVGLAYAGSAFYAVRVIGDRRRRGESVNLRSLHVKLTGAMIAVLALDGGGYLMAVNSLGDGKPALRALLEDIFVAVAIMTISVGLVLPGIISHGVGEVVRAAARLATGTVADLRRAMRALADGDLDAARADSTVESVRVTSRDELSDLARSFNTMASEVAAAAEALDVAREGLRRARAELTEKNAELERWGEELERRVDERTGALRRARDELAALATTDPLTALPNHRALVATIDLEIERSARYGHPCAILFVDVDNFKQLNDGFGHAVGDVMLCAISDVARTCLRSVDTLGRWGGEEFLIVLPETDAKEARATAERVRAAVAGHTFAVGGPAHVTCSIGTAVYPTDGPDRGALVDLADRAMYAAKRLGRNLAFSADDPVVAVLWAERTNDHAPDPSVVASTVVGLTRLVESRGARPVDHAAAVASLARRLAVAVGCGLDEVRDIAIAARLCDIGTLSVPDAILRKYNGLTQEDWRAVRRHVDVGTELVAGASELSRLTPIIRSHHERWDGGGYPEGLCAEAIPLGGRILAVANALVSMTTDRPHRAAVSAEAAIEELDRGSGSQFDPTLVGVARELVRSGAFIGVGPRD